MPTQVSCLPDQRVPAWTNSDNLLALHFRFTLKLKSLVACDRNIKLNPWLKSLMCVTNPLLKFTNRSLHVVFWQGWSTTWLCKTIEFTANYKGLDPFKFIYRRCSFLNEIFSKPSTACSTQCYTVLLLNPEKTSKKKLLWTKPYFLQPHGCQWSSV